MAFELPAYVELTQDQRIILNESAEKNLLAAGPPGSGKSVVAIYRAANLIKAGQRVLLLVYNKPLQLFIDHAVKTLSYDITVRTYHKFLKDFYMKSPCPPVLSDEFDWDYKAVNNDFLRAGVIFDTIIIDEAQDFPAELLMALTHICKHMNCFMDNDQAISNNKTSYEDVSELLGILRVYKLKDNFRNTKEIYTFAKIYKQDSPFTSKNIKKTGDKPLFLEVKDKEKRLESIVNLIQRNSNKTIGIFTNAGEQVALAKELNNRLGNKNLFVQAYDGNNSNSSYWKVDFNRYHIFVLTTGAIKGLEFDVVIIPQADQIKSKRNPETDASIFYVATTRARKDLFCYYKENKTEAGCIDIFEPLLLQDSLVEWEKL